MRTLVLLSGLVLSLGCTPRLAAPARPPESSGATVYEGRTFSPEGQEVFRYQRTTTAAGGAWTSTHTSRDAQTGAVVVVQRAEHDDSYTLHGAVEDHRQLGVLSQMTVEPDGSLRFTTRRRGRLRTRTEGPGAPAVVGPTLFGWLLTHWDPLLAGERIPVRFVVAERSRSYRFELFVEPSSSSEDNVVVAFRPKSPVLRASLPPMRITLDTQSRTILRYEGRVPPRWAGRPLDARVEYQHVRPYR